MAGKKGQGLKYTEAIADEICTHLSNGNSLNSYCLYHSLAIGTVLGWLAQVPEFSESYARARSIGIEAIADDIQAIADRATVEDYNVARLQIDSRKWLLSKMRPDKYGDVQPAAISSGPTLQLVVMPAGRQAMIGDGGKTIDLQALVQED